MGKEEKCYKLWDFKCCTQSVLSLLLYIINYYHKVNFKWRADKWGEDEEVNKRR